MSNGALVVGEPFTPDPVYFFVRRFEEAGSVKESFHFNGMCMLYASSFGPKRNICILSFAAL